MGHIFSTTVIDCSPPLLSPSHRVIPGPEECAAQRRATAGLARPVLPLGVAFAPFGRCFSSAGGGKTQRALHARDTWWIFWAPDKLRIAKPVTILHSNLASAKSKPHFIVGFCGIPSHFNLTVWLAPTGASPKHQKMIKTNHNQRSR